MAISAPTQLAVRSANTNGQTSWAANLGASIPASALCVMQIDVAGGSGYPTSVTDDHGNTWTIVQHASRNSQNWVASAYFYYASAPGQTTVTAAFASSNEVFGWAGYVTGTDTTPKDADGNGNTFGASVTASTSTTLAADDEISFAVCGVGLGTAPGLPANYTSLSAPADGVRIFAARMAYRLLSGGSGTTESATFTTSGSRQIAAGVITFKPATGGGSALTQAVNDTLTGTDALAKTAAHPVADTGTLADTTAKAATHPLTDAGTLTDTVRKAPAHPVADTGTLTDASTRAPRKGLADTLTGTDTQAKTAAHPVTDTLTGTDAQAKTATHPVADTGTLSDQVNTGGATAWTLPLADTLTSTDAVAKTAQHPVADTGSLTDASSRTTGKRLTDTGTLADQATTSAGNNYTQPVADTLTGTDALTRTWVARLVLADLATVTDTVTSPQFPPAQNSTLNVAYTQPTTRAAYQEPSHTSHTQQSRHASHTEHAHLAYREHT